MRILVLAWEHPPRVHGGLGRHVHALTRELARAGHEVHVVATGTPSAPAQERVDGVEVHRVRADPAAPWPQPDWPQEAWLAEIHGVNAAMGATASALAADRAFDLLHAHDWMVGAAAAAVIARSSLPLVVTLHSTERGRHQGWLPGALNRWIDARERALAQSAAQVIVCSQAMAAQVEAQLAVPAPFVVGNGVDIAVPRPRRRARRPDGERRVLFVGRLEYEKGVQVLLQALALLDTEDRPISADIAGEGTFREGLEALADELGLGSVARFHGFCDADALQALHLAADVAVAPSLYEPFGLVALEAMAVGTPLVASRTGGLEEIVSDGSSGLLVTPDDPQALAAAIALVLDETALASRLRRAGRRRAATATWSETARRTAAVYAAVCPSRAPHPL